MSKQARIQSTSIIEKTFLFLIELLGIVGFLMMVPFLYEFGESILFKKVNNISNYSPVSQNCGNFPSNSSLKASVMLTPCFWQVSI